MRIPQFLFFIALILASYPASAEFFGRFETEEGSGEFLAYYDNQLDITWMTDANVNGTGCWPFGGCSGGESWQQQMDWVAGLTLDGVDGWRLPNMDVDGDGVVVDCTEVLKQICRDNEFGHLHYYGAGFVFGEGVNARDEGVSEPFFNLFEHTRYWSITPCDLFAGDCVWIWNTHFHSPSQFRQTSNKSYFAWAVHDGDVGAGVITDFDSDGVLDVEDNCPSIANPNQENFDGDSEGDVCDLDDDNDGVPDTDDIFPFDPDESADLDNDGLGNNADTDDDGDGMPDSYETDNGLDPLNRLDAFADADGDGFSNRKEFRAGTDPQDPDSKPSGDLSWLYWLLLEKKDHVASPPVTTEKVVLFVVNQSTYANLGAEIDRFMDDITNDTGATSKLTIIDSNETPSSLRDRFRGETDLWGAFFIGDVPIVSELNGSTTSLSDQYYRAYKKCPYTPTTNPFVVMASSNFSVILACRADIWVSRILATKSGSDGVEQIRSYLDKNHATRDTFANWSETMWFGSSGPGGDAIDFQSEFEGVFINHPLYEISDVNVMQVDDPNGQKAEFIDALGSGREMVMLSINGTPGFIQFQGPNQGGIEKMFSSEVRDTEVTAKIVEMETSGVSGFGTGVGDYQVLENFAAELLHTGDVLLVKANPNRVFYLFGADFFVDTMSTKYKAYGLGFSHAEIYSKLYDGKVAHYFGDPTVPLRNRAISSTAPAMSLNGIRYGEPTELSFDFGSVAPEVIGERDLVILNSGKETLIVGGSWIVEMQDMNDTSFPETSGFIYLLDGFEGVTAEQTVSWQIPPGDSTTLSFLYRPGRTRDPVPSGTTFNGIFSFYTNDPRIGAFTVRTIGTTE